ncbi:AsmA-like C-terminal region-containing protein [Tateyamaria omphalii]|uniref:AsmA family protein n=1 Tax=Tateyamaria omphalii TaxID=299262 RepID=UPI001C99065F|nr:AsmA family protein [Tateyamaria omphalii]MBY5935002.1 AsmA-like C-terminal region-containing protein [Tateyamaria omphalii]
MTTHHRDTHTPWVRRIAIPGALALICASAVFLFSKRDLDTIARIGINSEIGRIAGEHAALRDDSSVTLRPDLRVVVADPVFDFGEDDEGALTLARLDATLRPTPLLKGEAEIASLHLHRPRLSFDGVDVSTILDPWFEGAENMTAPANIEIVDGVVDVADALYLSDLNLLIAQDSGSEGLLVQGDFIVGARRAVVELQLDDPRRTFSDIGSQGRLSVRFEAAEHALDQDQLSEDTDIGVLADLRRMVDGVRVFGRGPLTIEGQFAVAPEAIRISDATFSHSGIALTGDLNLRAGSDLPVFPQLLAFQHSVDVAVSDLMRQVDTGNWADAPIRTDWINGLEVDFDLAGQDIAVGGATIDDVSMSLIARQSGLSLDVSTESETLGRFSARTDIRKHGEVAMVASLSDASVTMLTQPIASRMQARLIGTPQLPEGALNADVQLAGRGMTVGALFDSLSGSVSASMQDGSLSGGDVTATLQTLANGRQFMTKEKGPLIPAAGRTYFDLIDGQVGIEAGTARISRLNIAGERLEIDMLGEVGLKTGAVSVVGNAQLSAAEETEAENIARHVDLPFGIGGTVFTPMVAAGVPQFEIAAHVPPHRVGP